MGTIKFSKIGSVKSPCRAHPTDAGIDFFVPDGFNHSSPYYIQPGESILIKSCLKVKVPENHALILFNKSGVAATRSLILGSCVVDESYQGELIFNLHNISKTEKIIEPGDKIVQGILLPMNYLQTEEVPIDDLYSEVSERGSGGFGSTGN